jgi:VPS inhibitor protein A
MPISKEFLPLFKEFVSKYQHSGATTFYNLSKEHHHDTISKDLNELLIIITGNNETLHDVSIIDYLNELTLSSAKTNPYLLEYWLEFKTQYKLAKQKNNKQGNHPTSIKVGPEGTPLEGMIRDLRHALVATQTALTLSQQTHATELELLRKQLSELKAAHSELAIQNATLREQVKNEHFFDTLHPQIVLAQEQINSFSALLTNLNKVTFKRNNPIEDENHFSSALISEGSSRDSMSVPSNQTLIMHLNDPLQLHNEQALDSLSLSGCTPRDCQSPTLIPVAPQAPEFLHRPSTIPGPSKVQESKADKAPSIPKSFSKSVFFEELTLKVKEREKKALQYPPLEKKNQ